MKRARLLVLPFVAVLASIPHQARSTVTTETRSVTHTGSGGSSFAVTFPFLESGDLVVTKITVSSGAEEVLSEGADYTVTKVGASGGTVDTSCSGCEGAISSSFQIKIERTIEFKQSIDFSTQTSLDPQAIEDGVDKCIMGLQQLEDGVALSSETQDELDSHIGSNDDHTGYLFLSGRSGGQAAHGGTATGEHLTLESNTSNDGRVVLGSGGTTYYDESGDDVVVGDDLTCGGNVSVSGDLYMSNGSAGSVIYGGSSSGDDLYMFSTSDATRGDIKLGNVSGGAAGMVTVDSTNSRVGINAASPEETLHVDGDLMVDTGATATNTIYGGNGSGDNLQLGSTSNATKGDIEFGTSSVYDEANTRLGVGTTTPSVALDIVGEGAFTSHITTDGTIYGGDGSGDDLAIKSTSDATQGDVTISGFANFSQSGAGELELGSLIHNSGKAPLNAYDDSYSLAAWFWANGNTAGNEGITIQAGLDNPSNDGDVVWVNLEDGNGDPVSIIRYENATSGAAIHTPSDRRLKDEIADSDIEASKAIASIPVRSYRWKRNGAKVDIGFVAQEVEKHYPQAVSEHKGTKMLSLNAMIPLLFKAAQESHTQQQFLQDQIDALAAQCGESQ